MLVVVLYYTHFLGHYSTIARLKYLWSSCRRNYTVVVLRIRSPVQNF